jgi:chromosome segregation ATPase
MSKSWDELKNTSDLRLRIEKYWSRAAGEIHATKEQSRVAVANVETISNILHSIELNIASLREGIISIEDHLTKIEERLTALEESSEDLDEHR